VLVQCVEELDEETSRPALSLCVERHDRSEATSTFVA